MYLQFLVSLIDATINDICRWIDDSTKYQKVLMRNTFLNHRCMEKVVSLCIFFEQV